ncbi:MAG TPA: HAD family hydrolase [Phenylobacterium sp.]|nr:HAD family hydrolase [Phenylobacterium sp.]
MPSPAGPPERTQPPRTAGLQLLISDIDGTLVTPDKILTAAAQAAVQRLDEAGIGFSIISARPPRGMQALATALGVRLPFAAFNGGSLVGPDFQTISARWLPATVARSALALLAARQVDAWVFADDAWRLLNPNGAKVERERLALGFGPNVVSGFEDVVARIDKIVGVSDDHNHLAAVELEMQTKLGESANVSRSQPYYLDITPPGADKGHGVRAICERAGVPLANTAVIGDMRNDVAMFRIAGLAIAMGQAPPDVQAAAQLTTAGNTEEGFAKAVNRFILPMAKNG